MDTATAAGISQAEASFPITASPPAPSSRNKKRQKIEFHRRNYQACDLCRKRKIRCDLGDLDDPQPPCTRCRRELRDCTFASGHGARHARPFHQQQPSTGHSSSTLNQESVPDLRVPATSGSSTAISNQAYNLAPDNTPLQSDIVLQEAEVRSLGAPSQSSDYSPDAAALNPQSSIPKSLLDTTVRNDTDALHLLFDTAFRRSSHYGVSQSIAARLQLDPRQAQEPPESVEHMAPVSHATQRSVSPSRDTGRELPINGLANGILPTSSSRACVWSQFRPCQQRSLSPAEAEAYINYFFTVLNKQMPILSDWFSYSAHHESLLAEDSVLCCTILAIASRYFTLPGHNGHSRGYLLHDLFFRQVQDGLQGLLWGIPLDSQNGMTIAGALESLVLLTQWQPRGLHVQMSSLNFPNAQTESAFNESASDHDDPVGADAMAIALRSDLMCWRLMNLASSLGHEYGIFSDQKGSLDQSAQAAGGASRLPHIRQMLYLYTSGLAARLKRPNPFKDTSAALFKQQREDSIYGHPIEWQKTLNGWVDLVEIGNVAAELLYESQQGTRELIKSGKYVAMVRRSEHLLSQWWEINKAYKVSATFRSNIEIEYHYLRIFVHSVALQAVLDRSVSLTGWRSTIDAMQAEYRPTLHDTQMLQEVINSCCKVYEMVIELHKIQALRNVTLPLLLRIITASMFGLKVVALNLKEENHLMHLLRHVILALRESAVDDLHIAGYYGRLLDRLTQQPKTQLGATSERADNRDYVKSRPPLQDHQALPTNVDQQHHDTAFGPMNGRTDDWSDWFAFQFDPTLASIGEMGPDNHAFFASNSGFGLGQG